MSGDQCPLIGHSAPTEFTPSGYSEPLVYKMPLYLYIKSIYIYHTFTRESVKLRRTIWRNWECQKCLPPSWPQTCSSWCQPSTIYCPTARVSCCRNNATFSRTRPHAASSKIPAPCRSRQRWMAAAAKRPSCSRLYKYVHFRKETT